MKSILVIGVNPEPWQAPKLGIGRGAGGKWYPTAHTAGVQRAYQEALHDNIREALPNLIPTPKGQPVDLTLVFWRQVDAYTLESGRKSKRKLADATNMQKATEDALQKILFENDVDVRRVTSETVVQGEDVEPKILIVVKPWSDSRAFWESVVAGMMRTPAITPPGNVYFGG